MLDFSKWVAMWDAYDSGGAVPGSAASICWNIGFGLILFGLLSLTILIIVFSVEDVLTTKGIGIFLAVALLMGAVLAFTSLAPALSYAPAVPAALAVRANHQDMESGRFGRMQERRSKTTRIKA